MLFMGEEYGETAPFQYFSSHPEPELADAVRQGRRKEFAAFASFAGTEVPDPQDPATLERSTLDPNRQTTVQAVQRSALWSDLLRLRQTHPAIGNGRLDLVEVLDATAEVMTLTRRDRRAAPVLVTVNLAPAERTLPAPPGSWSLLMWTESARFGGRGGPEPRLLDDGSIRLPARTAALWDRVESAGPERERG
jgi:maltooligosyltrehalose trehalohydrolase